MPQPNQLCLIVNTDHYFQHHSEVHQDLPRWQYQCPSCVKPMTDLQLLVIHCEKRHQETLVYPIKCNTCDRPFIFQEALLHHQKVTEHFNLDFKTPTSTPDFSTSNSSTMKI